MFPQKEKCLPHVTIKKILGWVGWCRGQVSDEGGRWGSLGGMRLFLMAVKCIKRVTSILKLILAQLHGLMTSAEKLYVE